MTDLLLFSIFDVTIMGIALDTAIIITLLIVLISIVVMLLQYTLCLAILQWCGGYTKTMFLEHLFLKQPIVVDHALKLLLRHRASLNIIVNFDITTKYIATIYQAYIITLLSMLLLLVVVGGIRHGAKEESVLNLIFSHICNQGFD
jgi:hypothetical protein